MAVAPAAPPVAPYATAPVAAPFPAPGPVFPPGQGVGPTPMYVPAAPTGAPQWPQAGLLTGQVAQGRARKSWFSRLPVLGKLAIVFGALVLIGGGIQAALPSPPGCTFSCVAISGPLQPAGKSFSSQLFSFQYPSGLTLVTPSKLGSVVTLSDSGAPAFIWAGQGQEQPAGLIPEFEQKVAAGIPVEQVQDLGQIFGAEIGFTPGSGEFYSGQIQQQNGEDLPVGIGVIAAQSGDTWAVIAVLTVCFDVQNSQQEACNEQDFDSQQEGLDGGSDYDDVLARWHWAS
ncbi:MAG: hypothetical protein ACLQVK_20425 [Acidimicrobiales bacterium]